MHVADIPTNNIRHNLPKHPQEQLLLPTAIKTMSLTPHERNAEATNAAMWEGSVNGLMTLIPSTGAVYMAMRNPRFLARTNMQSRTALAIMPALFVFAWTAVSENEAKSSSVSTSLPTDASNAHPRQPTSTTKRLTYSSCLLCRPTGRKVDPQNEGDCPRDPTSATDRPLGRKSSHGLEGKCARPEPPTGRRPLDGIVPQVGRKQWCARRPW